jgi:integrase
MEADDDEVSGEPIKLPPTLTRGLRRHKQRQDVLKQRLGDDYEDNGLVFCQVDGRPIDPRHDLADWHRILTDAGLPKRGTHVTRRTAATMLHDGGEDIVTIQHVLGHADIRTTRRYMPASARRTAGAAKTAERALFAPVADLGERRARKAAG